MIKFDGDWLCSTPTTRQLQIAGYMVGTIVDNGVRKYTLHNQDLAYGPEKVRWPVVYETTDLDELNNIVKLLLSPEG